MTARFQLIQRIASSGFSTIDHIRDEETGIQLALKRPRPNNDEALAQWHRELEVLSSIRHENVVALHDSGEDSDGPWMALEWIHGDSLAKLLEPAKPLAPEALPPILTGLLSALQVLHDAGYAHADINASNVLLCPDGRPKLIDFGNAWPLIHTEFRSFTEANVGSIHYMAPERFAGRPPSVSSDLYALGILASQWLLGHLPFEGDRAQIITAHLRSAPPALPPCPCSSWILQLLAKDPSARPASALDAQRALIPG